MRLVGRSPPGPARSRTDPAGSGGKMRTATKRETKRTDESAAPVADTAQGFDRLLVALRQAGGAEVEMPTLGDLEVVARVRGLPVLRHRPADDAGWTHYLVMDGANRLAFRYNERNRDASS